MYDTFRSHRIPNHLKNIIRDSQCYYSNHYPIVNIIFTFLRIVTIIENFVKSKDKIFGNRDDFLCSCMA